MIRPLESAPTDTASGEPPAEVVTPATICGRRLDAPSSYRCAPFSIAGPTIGPRVEPLALRLDELADALGVNRRTLEREPHRRPSAQA